MFFRDELREWCNKGYDYIGAPWLQRPVYKLPVISGIMHLIHSYHKFRGKPSKQDLYGKIGNGGLSLRKVASHYRITCEQNERIDHYLAQKRYHLYNEDVFWATEANGFTYPKVKEAIRFSFDKYPGYCYKLNNRQLPFGCHSWYKRKMKKILDGFYSFTIILTTCSSKLYEYIQNINMQYRLLLLFPSRNNKSISN